MKLLLATRNKGKIAEFKDLLKTTDFKIVTIDDLGDPNFDLVEESGLTYYENALIKAKAYYEHFHIPVLADDSGLEVDALNGAPGLYSARFGGDNLDDKARVAYLLKELKALPNQPSNYNARFVATVVLYEADKIIHATGVINGQIIDRLQGSSGFGYDPIFYLTSEQKTMAELTPSRKNQISHRALAINNLLKIRG